MANAVKVNENLTGKHPYPDRRNDKIGNIFTTITRFALDFSVNDSIKGVTGLKKLYKIVQERLTDASTPLPLISPTKPEGLESVKKMEMRTEEIPGETSKLKHLNTTSTKLDTTEPGMKKPNEGSNRLDASNTDKKRIFIRSRL